MTRISFYSDGGRQNGFIISGHTGFDDYGQDIVCAAATSAVRLCETIVRDVLCVPADVSVNGENAEISFFLKGESSQADAVLRGMLIYFVQLAGEYPDNINVVEVKRNA